MAAVVLGLTPSMGDAFFGSTGGAEPPVNRRSFVQRDAVRFCGERATDFLESLGGMAAAATVSDWRMMEVACSAFAGTWTGIRATLDARGSASAPGVRWRFTDALSVVDTDDALLNSLLPDPAWVDARCNCAWDAGFPRDVLRVDGNLTDNVCVYLHNRACDGLEGAAWLACVRPAVGPPAERWRGVYLRNAPCTLQLPAACCGFAEPLEDAPNTRSEKYVNARPRFATASFPDNPVLDVRVADAWPPGTVLLQARTAALAGMTTAPTPPQTPPQTVPVADDDCRGVFITKTLDNSAGMPQAMTQLRLLAIKPGGSTGGGEGSPSTRSAAPVVTLDPIRGALLFTGSGVHDSSSSSSSSDRDSGRVGRSVRVQLGVLDGAGCPGVEPLEVRVTVLPSYRVDGADGAPPPSDVEPADGGVAAKRAWAPNSPPLLLLGVPADNAPLWPHRTDAPPAVVFPLAGQGTGTDMTVVAFDSDPCPPPAGVKGGISRSCAAARVDAVVIAAGSSCPTCQVLVRVSRPLEDHAVVDLPSHNAGTPGSGAAAYSVTNITLSLRPVQAAFPWPAGAPGDSIVSIVTLRACDGLGSCTDSARVTADPDGVVGGDVRVMHIGLACSAPCGGEAPVELAGCAIGGGGATHNRVCFSWPQVAFGRSPAALYGSSALEPLQADPPALTGVVASMLVALAWVVLHVGIAAAACGGGARSCSCSRGAGLQHAIVALDAWGSGTTTKGLSPAVRRRRTASAARAARRSLACTWAAAGCVLLLCTACVLASLPVADAGSVQALVAAALRPPGTAWVHPAVPPLPRPVLLEVLQRVEALRGGAPAVPVPVAEWLRLAILACLAASVGGRLLLPVAVTRRVDALLRASADNASPMGGIVIDDSLGTLSTAARLHQAATLVASAAATACMDAAWGYRVLAGSAATRLALLQVLCAPPLLYSSELLPDLVARLVAGRLPASSSSSAAAALPESTRYAAQQLTLRLRRAVRHDVLVLGALADAPLAALLAWALSERVLRASSPLATVFLAAAGVHAAGFVSLAAPWRWFELGAHAASLSSRSWRCCGSMGRRPASDSPTPASDAAAQQQQQQLVEPARAYLAQHSLLARVLARLAPPSVEAALVEAYAAVHSDVLPLLAAASPAHGAALWGAVGKRGQGAEVEAEEVEVGGVSPLGAALAAAAAAGGGGGKPPPPSPSHQPTLIRLGGGEPPRARAPAPAPASVAAAATAAVAVPAPALVAVSAPAASGNRAAAGERHGDDSSQSREQRNDGGGEGQHKVALDFGRAAAATAAVPETHKMALEWAPPTPAAAAPVPAAATFAVTPVGGAPPPRSHGHAQGHRPTAAAAKVALEWQQ